MNTPFGYLIKGWVLKSQTVSQAKTKAEYHHHRMKFFGYTNKAKPSENCGIVL